MPVQENGMNVIRKTHRGTFALFVAVLVIFASNTNPAHAADVDASDACDIDPAMNQFTPGTFQKLDDKSRPQGWDDLSAFDNGKAQILRDTRNAVRFSNANENDSITISGHIAIQPQWKWLTVHARVRGRDLQPGPSDAADVGVRFTVQGGDGKDTRVVAIARPRMTGGYRDWTIVTKQFQLHPGDTTLIITAGLMDYIGSVDVEDILVVPSDPATQPDPKQIAQLQDAIQDNDVQKVKQLIAGDHRLLEARNGNNDGGTPLIITAWTNRPDVTKLLLDLGADKEAMDRNWGSAALGWAGFWGRPKVAKLLLDAGAKVNGPDGPGPTPLESARFALSKRKSGDATDAERNEVIELLESHGGTMQRK
jgi:Ankyrin repeats (3 copies)